MVSVWDVFISAARLRVLALGAVSGRGGASSNRICGARLVQNRWIAERASK